LQNCLDSFLNERVNQRLTNQTLEPLTYHSNP